MRILRDKKWRGSGILFCAIKAGLKRLPRKGRRGSDRQHQRSGQRTAEQLSSSSESIHGVNATASSSPEAKVSTMIQAKIAPKLERGRQGVDFTNDSPLGSRRAAQQGARTQRQCQVFRHIEFGSGEHDNCPSRAVIPTPMRIDGTSSERPCLQARMEWRTGRR